MAGGRDMLQPGISNFGKTFDGSAVHRIVLSNGELSVAVLTLGAIVQSVKLRGVPYDLTLGSDELGDYEGSMQFHGSLIGPVVNRITGASPIIAGKQYRMDANQDGRISLHCGSAGTHRKIWQISEVTDKSLILTTVLRDGDGGLPGLRRLTAKFSILARATFRLEVTASSDAATLINVANHSYWNLDGSPDWSGHRLTVLADHYLPTTEDFTPTGEVLPVERGGMDFRTPREIRVGNPPFDTNFCLADRRRKLTEALTLQGQSGLTMTVSTTEPGIQVYDGRNARRPGKSTYEGLAIEAQYWPDAPNHSGFPSIILEPGQYWQQITEWSFHS